MCSVHAQNNYALHYQQRSGIRKVRSAISTHVRSIINWIIAIKVGATIPCAATGEKYALSGAVWVEVQVEMQRVQRYCYDRAAQTIVAPTLVQCVLIDSRIWKEQASLFTT